jgi:hypothetical protein
MGDGQTLHGFFKGLGCLLRPILTEEPPSTERETQGSGRSQDSSATDASSAPSATGTIPTTS